MDGMEKSQYEYLRLNKFFLFAIGQWPYQTLRDKILVGLVFLPITSALAVLQGGGLISSFNVGDTDAFMESFAPFIIACMCIFKFINFIYNTEQMKKLLDIMRNDWKKYSLSNDELEILSRHYAIGKRITFNFATFLYGSMTPFMVMPSLPQAAESLGFYNLSGERQLMFRVEHFVDTEKYYYPLLIHSYFGTVAFITITVACDSMILLYVQHECALCEILGYRLRNFVKDDNTDIQLYPNKDEDIPYQNVRTCVILHKHIIEFAKIIEDANTLSFLFQLGFILMGVSFTQFQAIANIETPNKSLSFASFTVCLLCIILLDSWRGQQISDSTCRIFEYTMEGCGNVNISGISNGMMQHTGFVATMEYSTLDK